MHLWQENLVKTKHKRNVKLIHFFSCIEIIDISTFGLNIDKKQTFVYQRDLIPSLNEAELE